MGSKWPPNDVPSVGGGQVTLSTTNTLRARKHTEPLSLGPQTGWKKHLVFLWLHMFKGGGCHQVLMWGTVGSGP